MWNHLEFLHRDVTRSHLLDHRLHFALRDVSTTRKEDETSGVRRTGVCVGEWRDAAEEEQVLVAVEAQNSIE